MIAPLLDRLRQKDRNALARLLSYAARGEHVAEIQAALALPDGAESESPRALVIAVTGSGGVGKSSLLGKLLDVVRAQGLQAAVLACDPQSPLSGGALLGDRFRMGRSLDDGVFIRSLAAVSGHGGLADHLDVMIRLLETFGFAVIFVETVGAGQGDVAVRNLADIVLLLVQPESGDDVQWEKAGILECADVVVVHKADLPRAEQTAAQVRAALDLSAGRATPILRVSTKSNEGHAELWQTLQSLPRRRSRDTAARLLCQETLAWIERRFRDMEKRNDPVLQDIVARWQRGEASLGKVIQGLLVELQ